MHVKPMSYSTVQTSNWHRRLPSSITCRCTAYL